MLLHFAAWSGNSAHGPAERTSPYLPVTGQPQRALAAWLEGQGWTVRATADSPITGGDGNAEFLLWAGKR